MILIFNNSLTLKLCKLTSSHEFVFDQKCFNIFFVERKLTLQNVVVLPHQTFFALQFHPAKTSKASNDLSLNSGVNDTTSSLHPLSYIFR